MESARNFEHSWWKIFENLLYQLLFLPICLCDGLCRRHERVKQIFETTETTKVKVVQLIELS
jgi:hypothetical protein